MSELRSFTQTRRRPRIWVLVLIALLHVGLFYGLVRALAPDVTAAVENTVLSSFSVTVTAPPEEPPPPPPPPENVEPDEGAQGDPGRDAVPLAVTAPDPPVRLRDDPPRPRASSTGTARSSGAAASGEGTGAAGIGEGTGAGGEGDGRGANATVPVTDPVKIAGDINSARDYPREGREDRNGQSVTIAMTVGVDGRASNCRVVRASPDPVADRITCQLAVERFRFEPATNADGVPVPAPYGWRQRWF